MACFTGAGCASLQISTFRFNLVRLRASLSSFVFCFLPARRYAVPRFESEAESCVAFPMAQVEIRFMRENLPGICEYSHIER